MHSIIYAALKELTAVNSEHFHATMLLFFCACHLLNTAVLPYYHMRSFATHTNTYTHTHTSRLKSWLSLTKEPVALPQPDALYGLKTALLHDVYLSAIFTSYCVDVSVSQHVCVPHQSMFELLMCVFKCLVSCAHVSMVMCKLFSFMVSHCFLH